MRVTQGTQPPRTFAYDTAGRLLTATNPESGATEYTYDDNGNLKTKTDARNYVTALDYDRLDRLTRRQQPDGLGGQSTARLCYDGLAADSTGCVGSQTVKGALTGTWSVASNTTYTRDALLRVTASTQATDGYIGGFTYQYNVDGTAASMTYPSTNTVTYTYDRAGHVSAISRGTEAIASSVAYAPHGAVQSLTLGNGLFETVLYNNRLQPYEMNLGTSSGSGNVWKLVNTYGPAGGNNGNVLEQQITAPGAPAARQVYKYDHVNRLTLFTEGAANVSATTCLAASAPLCQQFGYDRWGNRLITDRSGVGPSLSEPPAFSASTNRIEGTGFGYGDGVGNLTQTPVGAFQYDAENRMISATTALGTTQYVYDAEGRRVKKVEGGGVTVYVNDAMGQLAAEYGGTVPATTTRAYLTQDHLGSTRVVTNREGTEVVQRLDYLPFGDEVPAPEGSWRLSVPGYTNAAAMTLKFTGKERDGETGLDYFGARYLSSAQGRFTSPDPVMSAPERLRDPQQFNRYAYARNNPLRFLDPTGERLQLSGDVNEAQNQLCQILGISDCASRITYNEKTNTITVDMTGIDLAKNEGASLLSQSVDSSKLYDLTLGSEFMTAAGNTPLDGIRNLNNKPDFQYALHGGRLPHERPAAGVDDVIAINPAYASQFKDSQGRRVPLWAVIFHELAEAYGKVDLGKQYENFELGQVRNGMVVTTPFSFEQGAHWYSADREIKLRNQRPNIQLTGRASDQLIRDPKP